MSTIRNIIDPNSTLPPVTFQPVEIRGWDTLTREDMRIFTGHEAIGECTVVLEHGAGIYLAHFDCIEIDETKRGHGLGLASYVIAIEHAQEFGLPFETQDYYQTLQATKIWELLAARGVADIIKPFGPSRYRPDRFAGKYRVPLSRQ